MDMTECAGTVAQTPAIRPVIIARVGCWVVVSRSFAFDGDGRRFVEPSERLWCRLMHGAEAEF